MSHLFANNATSRLKVITPAGSGTLTILDEDAEKFPSPVAPDIFLVTIDDRRTGQIEICACTARTGNILTVVRGQEGTVAQDFAEWATVSNRATAGTFQYLLDVVLNAEGWGKQEADDRFLNVDGDTATGALKGVTPLDPEDLTRKDYVDAQDATKASLVHTHPISQVVDLQTELDSKLEPAPSDGADYVQYNGNWTVFNWSTLDGKPASFPPQSHTHPITDVVDLASTLAAMDAEIDTKVGPDARADSIIYGRKNNSWVDVTQGLNWGQIPGQPETYPPSSHMHPIAEVINLQTTLNGKEPIIAPGSPTAFWAGDKTWKTIEQTAAAASIGDSPPSSPVPGQMWWESDTGYMFIRFQDVNSQQWVQINNPGLTDAPSDGQSYARKDGDWVGIVGGGPGGGISEAPTDGQLYSRRGSDATWQLSPTGGGGGIDQATADTRYVNVTGDTMTGVLTLNGTCTSNLHAVHKAYVDNNFAGQTWVTSQDALLVAKAGSTMTGKLTLSADPSANLEAATKQYVDSKVLTAARPTHVGDAPPGSPTPGQFWWDSDYGNLFIYYDDLSGLPQWVPASIGSSSPAVMMSTVDTALNLPSITRPSSLRPGDIWREGTKLFTYLSGQVFQINMTVESPVL